MERNNRSSGRGSERGGRDTERSSSRSFEYKKPTADTVKQRSEQRGGAEFDSLFKHGTHVFKGNDGDNVIRILPATWDDPKHFGFDLFVHYGIGPDQQAYLCAKEMKHGDGECPICEERARAVKDGDDDYAKSLKPSKRVLIYLIDRDAEKEGVQAWAAPWTVDRDINSLIVDKRSGEVLGIDDPKNGYDIEFSRKGKGLKTEYIGMQIARRESDLGDDDWLQYAIDNPLPDQLQFFDYDHIAKVFGGQSSKKDADDDFEGQDKKLRDKEMESSRGSRKSSKADDELSWAGVHDMTYDELCALIATEKLDIKADDSKNDEELADWVCEDLKISKREERKSRVAEKEPDESPRDKLRNMRRRAE